MPRKAHVGGPLDSEAPTGVGFKDDTLRADDRAFFLRVHALRALRQWRHRSLGCFRQ
jgi:hypothetical protein